VRRAFLFGAVAVGAFAAGLLFMPLFEVYRESSRSERHKARKES
jgi:hypothetical protein